MIQNSSLKKSLRQSLKLKRQTLSIEEQQQKSNDLMKIVSHYPEFIRSKTIAAYWPTEAEIDPRPLMSKALTLNKICFLPVLNPANEKILIFAEYREDDPLYANRYGILEPNLKTNQSLPPNQLDMIFLPLIAFDDYFQRLGRGAGYYDRTFAFLKEQPHKKHKKPLLLGLGYEFQHVEKLPQDEWDVELSGIATEKQLRINPKYKEENTNGSR